MFADLLQVAFQHVQHIHGVVVVVGVYVFLFVLDVSADVAHESFRQLGEVVDVVQRVQNAVYESLRQLTHCRHFLEAYHLSSAFANDVLQPVLVPFELAQP